MHVSTRFRGIPEHELTVNGTIRADFERDIADEQGRVNFAVGPESFKAICAGYACGNCLAYKSFGGSWSPVCPTCGAATGAGGPDQLAEQWWL